jgi:methionyl-tRNA formyltransferase
MKRIVIFGDSWSPITALLLDGTLREVQRRPDLEVAAFCVTNRHKEPPPAVLEFLSAVAAVSIKRLSNFSPAGYLTPKDHLLLHNPFRSNALRIARRHGLPVLMPVEQNINDPGFIEHVKSAFNPDWALSYFCPQIFQKSLLRIFDQTVNYHNGLLPKYAGIAATSWSIYCGEPMTGFTFHHIDEQIDGGNILIQGALPVRAGVSHLDLDYEKVCRAAGRLGELFGMLREGAPGRPQERDRLYFGRREMDRITRVLNPHDFALEELRRRIRAFRVLWITFSNRAYPVTRIEAAMAPGRSGQGFVFRTRDGVMAEARRLFDLPRPLYRILFQSRFSRLVRQGR